MKKWICAVLAVALLLLSGCAELKMSQYDRAQELYQAGDYTAAARVFALLGDYKNSKQMVQVSRYAAADKLFADGDYSAAVGAFSALGNYEDSLLRITECHYAIADDLVHAGDLAAAANAFEALGVYKDSADRVLACRYALAQAMLDEKQYLAAAEAFAALGDYANARDFSADARWMALQEFASRQDQTVTVGDVLVHLSPVENDARAVSIWAEKTLDLGFYTVTERCSLVIRRGQEQASYLLCGDTKTQSDGMTGYSRYTAAGTVTLGELTEDTLLPITDFAYYGQDVYGNVTQRTKSTISELTEAQKLLKPILEAAPALLEQTGYTPEDFGLTGLQ